MQRFFANWYALVRPEPSSEILDKRWAGIEKYCGVANEDHVFELVRLFFNRPVLNEASEEEFRTAFRDADSAFLMKNNDVEVQVLAGSAIANILEQKPSNLTDATALSVLCGNCRNLRSSVLIPDIISYATEYVARESVRVREAEALDEIKVAGPTKPEELSSLGASLQDGSLQTNPDALVKLIEKIASATVTVSRMAENSISKLSSNIAIQQEETNILWWLFGEHSRDREIHVGTIDFPALCLIVGKELADLTTLEPGARPAPAFMDRMLRTGRVDLPESISLVEAVNSSAREWRRAWMNSSDPHTVWDICPAHFAASKSLETEDTSAWVPIFESKAGFNASCRLAPLDLAMQTYQEALLIRLAKK
jgi:hypothetical protein